MAPRVQQRRAVRGVGEREQRVEPQKSMPVGGLRTDEDAYRDAFRRFLAGSDEKDATHAYLDQVVRGLPARRVLIDVGPADGTTTRHLSPSFERTVCVEPSEPMRRALARTCPGARVLPDPVLQARPGVRADLVLLSHVLYYIPRSEWVVTVRHIIDWLQPGGTALVLLQDPDNACMRMVRHFTGVRFDLEELRSELATDPAGPVGGMRLDTVPARYRTVHLEEAVSTAEFHLSVPADRTGRPHPARHAVQEYVQRHFRTPAGVYTIPHDQEVLRIERSVPR